MLQKRFRGLSAAQVARLFQGPNRSASNPFFRVLWSEVPDDSARFVVVTSTKFHSSAVVRNKFRRMLFELIRLHFSRWTEGVRVAIVVKHSALAVSKQELQKSFYELMKKSRLF